METTEAWVFINRLLRYVIPRKLILSSKKNESELQVIHPTRTCQQ